MAHKIEDNKTSKHVYIPKMFLCAVFAYLTRAELMKYEGRFCLKLKIMSFSLLCGFSRIFDDTSNSNTFFFLLSIKWIKIMHMNENNNKKKSNKWWTIEVFEDNLIFLCVRYLAVVLLKFNYYELTVNDCHKKWNHLILDIRSIRQDKIIIKSNIFGHIVNKIQWKPKGKNPTK